MEHHHFYWENQLQMAIFNSYVKFKGWTVWMKNGKIIGKSLESRGQKQCHVYHPWLGMFIYMFIPPIKMVMTVGWFYPHYIDCLDDVGIFNLFLLHWKIMFSTNAINISKHHAR